MVVVALAGATLAVNRPRPALSSVMLPVLPLKMPQISLVSSKDRVCGTASGERLMVLTGKTMKPESEIPYTLAPAASITILPDRFSGS